MTDSEQEFDLDLDINYGKSAEELKEPNIKDFIDNANSNDEDGMLIERCNECNRKMKTISNYDYVSSIWKTTINPVFDINKCSSRHHDHNPAAPLCVTCCSKKDYVDHKECYDRLSKLNDEVNRFNKNGLCNCCNVPFSIIHCEYGTCHTCYKKSCSLGFYDNGRMYQYVFIDWNHVEQYLICKGCYDDKKTDDMNIKRPIWVPDDQVQTCQYGRCLKKFGYIFGQSLKHHCRGCGKIMCTEHCSQYAYMPFDGLVARSCPDCFYKLNIKYDGPYKDLYKDHERKYKKN